VSAWTRFAFPSGSPPASRLPGRLGDDGHPVVSLVRLHGVITPTTGPVPRSVINSVSTEKVLERAFAPARLAAVALLVNSPGGSPTQSALVADRIRGLADEHDVPVLAFCEDVAASGGYWLACAADEIYAHPTSIVGSIGVISQSFGLEGLLQRIGVERRLYTAGEAKSRLDPFLPEKPEDVVWLRGLQDQLHEMFRAWVVARRGDRLARTSSCSTARCGPAPGRPRWGWSTGSARRAACSRALPRRRARADRGAPPAPRPVGHRCSSGGAQTRTSRSCRAVRPGG
jgi:signal peptide peptidase SppA